MAAEQPNGAFPRLNAALLESNAGMFTDMVVSLVGKAISFDGQNLTFECADGGKVQILMQQEYTFQQGQCMEIMGSPQEDKSFQQFICRDLGEDFDFNNYNQLISTVMMKDKYDDMFKP